VPTQLHAVRAPRQHAAAAYQRVWDAGDAVLPLPADGPDAVVAATLAAQRPAALIDVDAAGHAVSRALPDATPVADGTALVVTTSGSTGTPKGVVLPHAALAASVTASLRRLGCSPGDTWALALPTHHVAGITVLLRAQALGTPVVAVEDAAELLDASPAPGRRFVSLVPTQLHRLVATGRDLAPLGTVLLGGAAAPADLLAQARTAGGTVVTSYGMTETCGGCVYDGLPLDDVEVALDDRGRVRLRGPVLFSGYRGQPDAHASTDDEGWFTAADLGQLDAEGRLTLLGRADAVAISGGENIPLHLVEATIASHPDVAEAAVVARYDPEWGQLVVAAVVPVDASDPLRQPTLDGLRAYVRASLPASYAPRELLVAARLPRDAMGKVTAASVAAAAGWDASPGAAPRP
jgi:o-succinylbenzoate---CoA ligase